MLRLERSITSGMLWAVAALAVPGAAWACSQGDQQSLIHRSIPPPLPNGLFVGWVDIPEDAEAALLHGEGLRVKVRERVQGPHLGETIILKQRIISSCDTPFGNGRSGLIVAFPTDLEEDWIAEPVPVGTSGRLPDDFVLTPYYTHPEYVARAQRERLAGVAAGNGTPRRTPSLIADPQWRHTPTYDEQMRLYPERALRLRWEGGARVRCVHRQGRLSDCAVLSETPQGRGFGAAATRVAMAHVMQPGAPEGDLADLSIDFKITPEWLATYCPTLQHDEVRPEPEGGWGICMSRMGPPRTGPGK